MSGEVIGKMVSRRKILSQSRDELSYEPGPTEEPEDDVWFTKEKLYKVFLSSYQKHLSRDKKPKRFTKEKLYKVFLSSLSSTPAFMAFMAQKPKSFTKERNSPRYFVILGTG